MGGFSGCSGFSSCRTVELGIFTYDAQSGVAAQDG